MGDMNSSQSNSADQSLRSPLQLVPFTFSNSYADSQIQLSVNAIMNDQFIDFAYDRLIACLNLPFTVGKYE